MTHQNPITFLVELAIVVSSLLLAQPASASVFTYQGQLVESGAPVSGPVDLAFRLYDGAAGGMQIGLEVAFNNFDNFADGGEFTVALDFGAGAFPGEDRWLEIWVDGQALSPRQAVLPTPYAIHALMVSDGALPVPYSNAVDFSNAGNDFNGSFSGSHSGNGAGLTSLNASNLSTGTVGSGRVSGTYSNALTLPNAGNSFTGDGGGLMNIDWDSLVNVPPGFADGVDNASDIWNTNGNDAYYDAGNVGIGTSTTNSMLTVGAGDGANLQVGQAPQISVSKDAVDDKFRIQLTGSGYSGYQLQIGRDDGTHEVLLKGDVGIGTDNPAYPLHVVSNTTAIRGQGTGENSVGVLGSTDGGSGIGVYGLSTEGNDLSYGVYGESNSENGRAIYGLATSDDGSSYGVYGEVSSTDGRGVVGTATSSTGLTRGVYGETQSIGGLAVSGRATAGSGLTFGVHGHVNSTGGRAVTGIASANSGNTYGVFGAVDSPDGYGVFSSGELGASGTKSFVIDHPFDPENKYLKHYASEGPEPLNVYRGRVTLDGLGEAWIELPDYFEAINRDPLYALTPIGAAMPNLHVAEEVLNNEFRIAGGQPGMEVSWRVEAVRDDPYVRSRGAPVEVQKGEYERGLYQHPELYGQPPEKGINYAPTFVAKE